MESQSHPKWSIDADGLPAIAGSYALLITLARSTPLPPRRYAGSLPAGRYCYVGSARGPGGVRARGGRHLRRRKIRRWHVDWLTLAAADVRILALMESDECGLADRLIGDAGLSVPVNGFGSSDCRNCRAHLVHVPDTCDEAALAALLTIR